MFIVAFIKDVSPTAVVGAGTDVVLSFPAVAIVLCRSCSVFHTASLPEHSIEPKLRRM